MKLSTLVKTGLALVLGSCAVFALVDSAEGDAADDGAAKPAKTATGGALEADAATTGSITGVVRFKGEKPEMKPTIVAKDHRDLKVCGDKIPYERHIIGPKGEIANVVVSIEAKGDGAKLPAGKPRDITLTNDHCRFVPHVQATTRRSKLVVKSKDKCLHSALAAGAASFNVAIPSPGVEVTKRLSRPGWVILSCSTHSWMQAHIQVFKHDFFATTGKDGKFTLKGVPPGTYTVKFWHAGLEEQTKKITVEAGKAANAEVTLEPWK